MNDELNNVDSSNTGTNLNNSTNLPESAAPSETPTYISTNPDPGLKLVEEYYKKSSRSWSKHEILKALKAAAQHGFGKKPEQEYLDYIQDLIKGQLLLKITREERAELFRIAIESSANEFKNKMAEQTIQFKNKHFSTAYFK